MSIQLINTLLESNDSFELVRDQIAAILKANVVDQMSRAVAAGKDPKLWDLRVYTERSNPFEEFININPNDANAVTTPIVNIWYDAQNFDGKRGNVNRQQQCDTIFNIDVYGYGVAAADGNGHQPGDKVSALEAQRAVKLVRQILMADVNTYLQLPRGNSRIDKGYFAGRWVDTIQSFQPEIDERPVQNVQGMRITFNTSFVEFSPQYVNEFLEELGLTVFRSETGEIYLNKDFTYT